MSSATALPPATGGTTGTTGTGRRTAKTNWWLWGGVVGGLVGLAAILFFTLGGGDGAAQTAPAAPATVQLQPAGITAAGAVQIIPPPSPLEAQLGDVKNLDKFVQDKYRELKDEADKQRIEGLKSGNYYQLLEYNRRLEETARRAR